MPLKVLFIDDEVDICEIYRDYFSSPEIEVIVFSDPKKGLDFYRAQAVDVVFLDYRMPGTTGDLLASAMGGQIPKYLITGEINLETTYPFVSILSKPVELEQVSEILKQLLLSK